ncbi:MAG: hypothetical protein DCC67_12880 [Planctomycetota bacterium]|nr:MAG: hypothetical protein DCC67_12880 [Planctomycetota bacterium]
MAPGTHDARTSCLNPDAVTPLQRTFDALAKSHNEAATPTLIAALQAGGGPIFDGAIAALCHRRAKAGHTAVLRQWNRLGREQREVVKRGRCRMGAALREAVLQGDDPLFRAAMEFVDESGDFDLIPTLVVVAEQANDERSRLAVELTLRLVDQLSDWMASDEPVIGRDPHTIRYCVLESLERSVERYHQHERPELLEAFIVLAGPFSRTLRNILSAPHHACYQALVEVLATSANPSVLRLLTDMLSASETPHVVQHVISKRTDRPFVDALLSIDFDDDNPAMRRNLAQLKFLACCEDTVLVCTQFTPRQQAAAVKLLAATGAGDDYKLMLIDALLKHGSVEGRVAACRALHAVPGQAGNKLLLHALDDPEGAVQAAAVRQLRERKIPGTLSRLVDLVSSPLEEVAAAARESLSVFSFDNYAARFDVMDEGARQAVGVRVAKVDRTTPARLRQELAHSNRRQRLRALQMAAAMEMLPTLADAVVERLQDEDQVVRAAAADLLRFCTASDVRNALLTALGDRSAAVQLAAKNSLAALNSPLSAAAAKSPPPSQPGSAAAPPAAPDALPIKEAI